MEQQGEGGEKDVVFAVAAYWGPLCILPLIFKKDNSFCACHGKQGLVIFIFLVAGFLFKIFPFGGLIWKSVLFLYLLVFIWGSVQALMGKRSRIPLVSDLADKISI